MKAVPQKLKNRMEKLLDDKFINDFFEGNLNLFFEGAKKIKSIDKIIYKDIRGNYDYTLIIEFILEIISDDKKIIKKSVFCKAHSNEKKNKSIYYMDILYKNGFNEGLYQVPRSLIYLPEFCAGFYEGAQGHNLLYYLKHHDYAKINIGVKDAAHWLNKLHNVSPEKFNSSKPRFTWIKDNYPPAKRVLKEMRKNYSRLYKTFSPLYEKIFKYEDEFLKTVKKEDAAKIIYADYHPENIIIPNYSHQGATVIDFTDLSIGDQFRDVGTFMEQAEFMSRKYMPSSKSKYWPNVFLNEYLKASGAEPDKDSLRRVNLYRAWSCLRNIIYFYYKKDPNNVIWGLIEDANEYLNKIK